MYSSNLFSGNLARMCAWCTMRSRSIKQATGVAKKHRDGKFRMMPVVFDIVRLMQEGARTGTTTEAHSQDWTSTVARCGLLVLQQLVERERNALHPLHLAPLHRARHAQELELRYRAREPCLQLPQPRPLQMERALLPGASIQGLTLV
jgi:hypothetical protein